MALADVIKELPVNKLIESVSQAIGAVYERIMSFGSKHERHTLF